MYKGVFGFSVWFYGLIALLLAVSHQVVLLGGLLAFVFVVEKDEWLNRQIMQAFLMCLFAIAVTTVVSMLTGVFAIIPFFGLGIGGIVSVTVNFAVQLFTIFFAIRAFDRIHRGLDSDIPIIASFVNSMF